MIDNGTLQAALVGYQLRREELLAKIAELEKELGKRAPKASAPVAPKAPRKKRTMSAAARKRISDAQKKRWRKTKDEEGGMIDGNS